jgi:hypothetical protein
MDRYDDKASSTWAKTLTFPSRPTWAQLQGLGSHYYNWLLTDAYTRRYCTTQGGSCLLAVACYQVDDPNHAAGSWWVYIGTIPRGEFRAYMDGYGETSANDWWRAAMYTTSSHGRTAVSRGNALHAEDTVLFRANMEWRTLKQREGAEAIRILTFGSTNGRDVALAAPCNSAASHATGKSPSCEEVARTLGAKYIPHGGNVAWMDQQTVERRWHDAYGPGAPSYARQDHAAAGQRR